MNKKNLILSIAAGLLWANGVLAGDPSTEKDERILNSVTYIDEDADFKVGFDTADYLPEGFDPYSIYVDLDAVIFFENETVNRIDTQKYLPADFNAYAYPSDVESIGYIDANDTVELDFDIQKYLPEGFDPYVGDEK